MMIHRNQEPASTPARPPLEVTTGTAILTCMDLTPDAFGQLFGLDEGPVFMVSNAGGVATAGALLSLSLALGQVRRVIVLQHTDCASLPFTDCAQLVAIDRQAEPEPDFLLARGVRETIKSTVQAVQGFPSIGGLVEVQGYLYDGGSTHLVCF